MSVRYTYTVEYDCSVKYFDNINQTFEGSSWMKFELTLPFCMTSVMGVLKSAQLGEQCFPCPP
jgi:hypothetical protein